MDFIVWFMIIGAWVAVMKYRYHIYNLTGEWGWAAQYLWGNGTITAIVLMGMILIGVGVAYPFGVFDEMGTPQKIEFAETP